MSSNKETLLIQGDKPIGLCCDHAGFEMKECIRAQFDSVGIEYIDFGAHSAERSDYPDFGHQMGSAIDNNAIDFGIAVCGTGNGINMTLNKHKNVRAALCWSTYVTKMARAHNNANVLSLPGRIVSNKEACDMVSIFFNTEFEGGRHLARINKIPCE